MSKHATHSSRDELIGDFCDQFVTFSRALGTPQSSAVSTGCRTHFAAVSTVPQDDGHFTFAVVTQSHMFDDAVECKVITSTEDPEAVAQAAALAMTTRSQVLAGERMILDLLS